MGSQLDNALVLPNRRDVSAIQCWAKLFRIPNLFTVPGDQLAGYCLAGGLISGRPLALLGAIGAGLLLYAAGLAINDLVDVHEDVSERPWRPLATGLLDRVKVEWVAAILMILALLLGALNGMVMLSLVGMLVAAVLAYNTWFKRIPVVGSIVMGGCRALSLLLGSAAAIDRLPFPTWALLGAAATMSYIVAVAMVARNETRPGRLTWVRWLPAVLCLVWTLVPLCRPAAFVGLSPILLGPFLVVGLLAIRAGLGIGRHLHPERHVTGRRKSTLQVSAYVGSMIRALIFVQAMLVLIVVPDGVGPWIAGGVAALWIPSTWLGRSISSS